jgi:ubiquinone/menaquinone biosynthesis C-methylase UbiE
MPDDHLKSALQSMRDDWDRRARENARHYVATLRTEWDDKEFFASGEQEVANQILTDMGNICQGRDPGSMRVLEIGCGAARVTRALARLFGEVHAVDVSGEMIALARAALSAHPNAFVYQNNGMDLSVIPDLPFDFAFSGIVFQHIPSREVIENYLREVARLLRPGALLKLQVQGRPNQETQPAEAAPIATELPLQGKSPIRTRFLQPLRGLMPPGKDVPLAPVVPSCQSIDTWVGVMLTPDDVQSLCDNSGFELRYQRGAGTVEYWLWCFKK